MKAPCKLIPMIYKLVIALLKFQNIEVNIYKKRFVNENINSLIALKSICTVVDLLSKWNKCLSETSGYSSGYYLNDVLTV